METNWQDVAILLASSFIFLFIFAKWVYKYWERKKVLYLELTFPLGNLEAPWAIKIGLHKTIVDIYNNFKAKGYKYGVY